MAGRLLLYGMLAGILAGLASAGFFALAAEPSVDRAIAFENAVAESAGEAPEPEIVSRRMQKSVGLAIAAAAYGAAAGGFFGLAFAFAYGRIAGHDPRAVSAGLAAAGFIAIALVPALKYPANPPAIGSPESLGERTGLFFAMVVISVLSMLLAASLGKILCARFGAWHGSLIQAAVFVASVTTAALVMPGFNEIPAGFPADLLWTFRLASLGGQAVLWIVLGLSFGALVQNDLNGNDPMRRPSGLA
jgi:predicted cobalt transporter CbtA